MSQSQSVYKFSSYISRLHSSQLWTFQSSQSMHSMTRASRAFCCHTKNILYPRCSSVKTQTCCYSLSQRRPFWGLDVAFNKVDEERVRLAGPDRACSEWVLRNGGSIKWMSSSRHLKDYNLLPSTDIQGYKLEEIDLTSTDVVSIGFEHLKNLTHVKGIKLHGCHKIDDNSLEYIQFVKDTLEVLEVSSCGMITAKGLGELTHLKKLKRLIIYDLIEIRDLPSVVEKLRQTMSWCHIYETLAS